MGNPFAGKGRIRRASERQSSFESLVTYLRQQGGLSRARERQLRSGWDELDEAQRAFLLSLPRAEWDERLRHGKVRDFLRGEDD